MYGYVNVSQEVEYWLEKMAERLEKQMDEMRGRLLDSEIAQRRLDRLASHLCESSPVQEEQLSREICSKLIKRPVNPSVLANLMAGLSVGDF